MQPLANDAHAVSLPHASPCSSVWIMPAIRSQASFSLASYADLPTWPHKTWLCDWSPYAPVPAEKTALFQPHERGIDVPILSCNAPLTPAEARGNGVAV